MSILTITTDAEAAADVRAGSLTIQMSIRRPINVIVTDWPTIAAAREISPMPPLESDSTAFVRNSMRRILVREHSDGRRIVHGDLTLIEGPEGLPLTAGYLVEAIGGYADEDGTVRAIRRVGGVLNSSALAGACINALPAEVL